MSKPNIYNVIATGTTEPRDIRDRFSDIINVKDFGAIGDGVADDTAALQKAIDKLEVDGGGTLFIPNSTTLGISSTIFIKSNVTLLGDGMPCIKALSPFEGAMIQFGYTTGAVGPLEAPTNPCNNSAIIGIEIDAANKVTSKHYADGIDSGIIHVWLYCKYNKVINCDIHSAESGLVEVEDVADFFELRGCKIHDMISTSAATQNQNLVNVDGPENAIIEDNDLYNLIISGYSPDVSWGYGIRLHATDSCVVRNNRIVGGYHNILVDGRKNIIEKNNLKGSHRSGIVLYYNAFKCLYNVVVGNYIDANDMSIYENDAGHSGYVGWNTLIGNTAINALDISTEGSGTTVIGNNIYSDGGTTLYPRLTILGVSSNHPSSDFVTGSWIPTIDNVTNVSGGMAYGCRFTRIGNMVHVMGTLTFTVAATGAFELRMSVPVATVFASDYDSAGRHGDTFSVDGSVYAFTGSPAQLRLVGTATSIGAKTSRFTATYYIQ